MITSEQILQAVFSAVDDINQSLPPEQNLDKSIDTVLFGKKGKLDSLGLVNLIVAVEQKVEEELGVAITLADEKAMSQTKRLFLNDYEALG